MPGIFKKYFLFICCLLVVLDSTCTIDRHNPIQSTYWNDSTQQSEEYEDYDGHDDMEDEDDDQSWLKKYKIKLIGAAGIIALAGMGIYFQSKQPVKKPGDSDKEKPNHDSHDNELPLALPIIPEGVGDELLFGKNPLLSSVKSPTHTIPLPPASANDSGEGLLESTVGLRSDESSKGLTEVKQEVVLEKPEAGSVQPELPYPNLELLKKAMSLSDDADRVRIDKQIRDNIDCTNAEGKTLLHLVAGHKCVTAEVQRVINYGANVWVLAENQYAIEYIYSRWKEYNTKAYKLICDAMVRQRLDSKCTITVKNTPIEGAPMAIDNMLFFHVLGAYRNARESRLNNKEQILKYIRILSSRPECLKWSYNSGYYQSIFEYMLSNDIIDEDIVKAVLEANVNPNEQYLDGSTFMHMLAENVTIAQINDFPQKLKCFVELCKPNLLIKKKTGYKGRWQEELTVMQCWQREQNFWIRKDCERVAAHPEVTPELHCEFLSSCINILEPIKQKQLERNGTA